jgi:5-methylcytosine-specific restriction protein A
MVGTQPTRVDEIVTALRELGGTAWVGAIKDQVTANRGGRPPQYRSDKSYRETIQRLIEDHCPESDNFRRAPLFERVSRGRYRLMR